MRFKTMIVTLASVTLMMMGSTAQAQTILSSIQAALLGSPAAPKASTNVQPIAAPVEVQSMAEWILQVNQKDMAGLGQELVKTNCNKSEDRCLYVAMMEALSYVRACRAVVPDRTRATGIDTVNFEDVVDGVMKRWVSLNDAFYKDEVNDDTAPLAIEMKGYVTSYLRRIPLEEMSTDCSRIGMMSKGQDLVLYSDFLKATIDYPTWIQAYANRRGLSVISSTP